MTPWYFNPIMFQIGPFKAHWYGLMYALAFGFGYLYLHYSARGKKLANTEKDSLLIHVILGVLLGGRIGYILFYNLSYYLANPLKIIAVWEGGMSFHGGLLGVAVALMLYQRKHQHISFFEIGDIVVSIAPLGLFFGKIGNFINAELYGRIASNYCIHFPTDPNNCRYPSQLLEAFLEGVVLLAIVQIAGRKIRKPGILSAIFLVCYGIFRIFVEFFREPDPQIGFLFGVITEGQLLSGLMLVFGLYLFYYLNRKKIKNVL